MVAMFEKKLKLRSFQSLGPEEREQTPITPKAKMLVLDEGKPLPPAAPDLWCPMPNGQWLRAVVDNRMGVGKRIYRVELFDKEKKNRLAIFRRQTEAARQ